MTPFAGGLPTAGSMPPGGWRFDNAWFPPKSNGEVFAANLGNANSAGSSTFVGHIAGGLNAAAMINGTSAFTVFGSLIVSLSAAIGGVGGISGAALAAYLQLAASIAGSGQASALLTALANASAVVSGAGELSAVARALGSLSAQIVVTGAGLTAGNVGNAVWSALAAANNEVGSMGEKLNDAGSASNPWTEVIESGYTAAEILRLIAAAVQGNAQGLENGAPQFKGLDGVTTRIDATYLAGVRTVTGRDAD